MAGTLEAAKLIVPYAPIDFIDTDKYLEDGKTFYDIPYDIVKEYGIADVIATEEVAVKQLEAFGTTFGELFNDISTDTKAFA